MIVVSILVQSHVQELMKKEKSRPLHLSQRCTSSHDFSVHILAPVDSLGLWVNLIFRVGHQQLLALENTCWWWWTHMHAPESTPWDPEEFKSQCIYNTTKLVLLDLTLNTFWLYIYFVLKMLVCFSINLIIHKEVFVQKKSTHWSLTRKKTKHLRIWNRGSKWFHLTEKTPDYAAVLGKQHTIKWQMEQYQG